MNRRKSLAAFFTLLLCASFGLARQESARGRQADATPLPGPSPLRLPDGEGAWAVQIITRGGVMGVGRGDLSVSSDGAVACPAASARCLQALAPESVRTLAEAVAAVGTKRWEGESGAMCHDCYHTTMMLQRRESGRGERTYLFSWDDLSAKKRPDDVRRVYETALALAHAKP